MSNICVLGNSHVGCIRQAKMDIERAYPELSVAYFGAPRQMLETCFIDEENTFGPVVNRPLQKQIVMDVNGSLRIDIGKADAFLIVGYGFNIQSFLDFVFENDIMGFSSTKRARLCSEEFFADFVNSVVDQYLEDAFENFGELSNVVIMPAPYRAKGCLRGGGGHRKKLAYLYGHPEGRTIFETFMRSVEHAVENRGYNLMRQPQKTIVGSFLTKGKYSNGVVSVRDSNVEIRDHMHMNKDFGLAVFDKFVHNYL